MQRRIVSCVLLGAMACGSPGEHETPVAVQPAPAREPTEPDEEPGEPVAVESAPAQIERNVCASFSFDLRGMPHRGPRDVDPARIEARVRGMMHDVREAAGEPEPLFVHAGAGVSSFVARFATSAQCERAREVVTPPPPEGLSPRGRLRRPQSTECAPCSD